MARRPGSYWEYSQDGPALLAEAIQRAVGRDFQEFARNELFGPIGIAPGKWSWSRDSRGHTQGLFGLHMTADDFGRLGELMRRNGVWDGRRLLSARFVTEALTPVDQNGCYGYLIWLNASSPCVGPRVVDRPVEDQRDFESLPPDIYQYAGLFGQWGDRLPEPRPSSSCALARTAGRRPATRGGRRRCTAACSGRSPTSRSRTRGRRPRC